MPLIDLRLICDENEDYANAIEPSVHGGEKIAAAIASLLFCTATLLKSARSYSLRSKAQVFLPGRVNKTNRARITSYTGALIGVPTRNPPAVVVPSEVARFSVSVNRERSPVKCARA